MAITDTFKLDGKIAIITGASKGIGEAMARGLAEAGASVVVSSRKQQAVDEVAAAFRKDGLEATAIACHVGDPAQIETLVAETCAKYGGVDIIVNNAAINPVYGKMLETDLSAFDKIVAVNLKGPFLLAHHAAPVMKQRGGGSIINISSTAGLRPWPGIGVYSMSKAALISMSKTLAQELGSDGIRVHTICPGLFKTKLAEALWSDDKLMNYILRETPLQRIGAPEDLAGLVVFLASEASRHLTGGTYVADGGLLSWG